MDNAIVVCIIPMRVPLSFWSVLFQVFGCLMMSILVFSIYMFFKVYKALFQSTNSQVSYFYFVVASHDMSCDHDIVVILVVAIILWWIPILVIHVIITCNYPKFKWKNWWKVIICYPLLMASINGWQPSCFCNCICNYT